MTRRQLARTVADGRLLTFTLTDGGEPVVGYLGGMDDFHWMVLTPDAEMFFVHKGSAPRVKIAVEATYESEEKRDILERIIGPFREHLVEANLVPAHAVRQNASKGNPT
jgi:hypothetical protein